MEKALSSNPSSVTSLSSLAYIVQRAVLSLVLAGCASTPRETFSPEMGNPSMSLEGTPWSISASTQRARMASLQIGPPVASPFTSALPPVPQVKPIAQVEASNLLAKPNPIENHNSTFYPPQVGGSDDNDSGGDKVEDGDDGSAHIGRLLEATKLPEHQRNFLAGMRKKVGEVAKCMDKVDVLRESGDQFEPDHVTCFMNYVDACSKAAVTPEGVKACADEYNNNVQHMSTMAEKALRQSAK